MVAASLIKEHDKVERFLWLEIEKKKKVFTSFFLMKILTLLKCFIFHWVENDFQILLGTNIMLVIKV